MTIPHPRPTEPTLVVHREPVSGQCPECGAGQLSAYPVLSEGGWFDVVKCGNCLHSLSREPGPRLGPVRLLSDLV
jgi:vanillate/4-hydroxybenzoate decarboxylase subunit D